MNKKFILDQPIVLKDGTRGHYAGLYNNGGMHCIFTMGRTSWTVPPPMNLSRNLKSFEPVEVHEAKEGYFNDSNKNKEPT